MPPSRRIDKFKPKPSYPFSSSSSSSSSTKLGSSTSPTPRDIEKGLPRDDGGRGEKVEANAAREEAAVLDVIDDLAGGLDGTRLGDTAEGGALPRPVPEGGMGKDLVLAENAPTTDTGKKGGKKEGGKTDGGKKDGLELDPEDVKLYGRKKAKMIAEGKLVYEDGKGYDMSLVKAMYATVWMRWWKALVLSACGCEWFLERGLELMKLFFPYIVSSVTAILRSPDHLIPIHATGLVSAEHLLAPLLSPVSYPSLFATSSLPFLYLCSSTSDSSPAAPYPPLPPPVPPQATLQITAPLLTRKIIQQLTLANAYHAASQSDISTALLTPPKSVGYGIGLAVALFVMEISASLFTYQSSQRGAVVGFMMRASVDSSYPLRGTC